ncbi:response regulator transcription factor [Pigmentibacter ruber]|uniref:response regulator transcription factor n=1 Tax=Pigmentibacter ruber TaxID=2683196 RepID=UPI00131CE53B|nr:response regulator transcription factor [Pigmentibacter ruber]BFD31805.1 response regulator transcription factor [Pigmentibacter ruber]
MKEEKLRILIIEDDRDLNNLLKYTLEASRDYDVKSHFDGNGAFELISQFMPDLVLLDVMLPNIYGTEILKNIRDNPSTAGILVILLTARSQEKDKVEGFEAGADDYITKPFSPRELMLRVNALLRRSHALKFQTSHNPSSKEGEKINPSQDPFDQNISKIISVGTIKIFLDEFKVTVNNEVISLTATEYQLLVFLCERVGKLQSREALLQKVWGYEGQVNTRTVDTHIKRLRQKLGAAGSMIETIHGFGYQLIDPH